MSLVGAAVTRIRGEHLYIAMFFPEIEIPKTQMVFYDGKEVVGRHDINARVRTVTAHKELEIAASADKFGSVIELDGSDVSFQFIEGPGTGSDKFGYLKSINFVGDDLFACGDLCQIYQRGPREWRQIAKEYLIDDKLSTGQALNSLDGFSSNEIYVVGDRGRILTYTKQGWKKIDSVTNASLEMIKCFKNDRAYAVGDNGIVLSGKGDQWTIHAVVTTSEEYKIKLWDIEFFQNCLYVISSSGLFCIRDDEVESIDIPLSEEEGGSNICLIVWKDSLWVIKANALISYDGNNWTIHRVDKLN